MTMASGELLQLHHREDLSLDEPTYYEIVDRKTGALIGLSCSLGAAASGADDETVDALKRFGRDMGIAFQIKDDLLDLMGEETVIGKSVRRDLAKGKLTLPLIHALGEASPECGGTCSRGQEPGRGRGPRATASRARGRGAAVDQLVATMRDLGSIEYARGLRRDDRRAGQGVARGPAREPASAISSSSAPTRSSTGGSDCAPRASPRQVFHPGALGRSHDRASGLRHRP
jgi:geranylgeranyl pyrophosphate synthase